MKSEKFLLLNITALGAHIKYVGGGPEGFTNFFKKIRSPGDHRPKYFMAQ